MTEDEVKILLAKMAFDDHHSSLKTLYVFYGKSLLKFARSFVKCEEVAEEIVDDVFIRIWLKRTCLTDIVNFKSYLYVAVKNKALNHLSKSHLADVIQLSDIHAEIPDCSPSGEEKLYAQDTAHIVEQAVAMLPLQCRNIYRMVKDDGMKYKDVALLMNISVKTVEYHMGNALKRIAIKLSENSFPLRNRVAAGIFSN